jgi:hypothetical protein
MRYISLAAVLAALVLAPTASATVIEGPLYNPVQNLSSPDAQDANAGQNAQSLQDLIKQHAGPHYRALTRAELAALAQEQYYGSYGKAAPLHRATTHDGSPWDAIVAGIALIAIAGAAVGIAVRSRRSVRVAV